MLKAKNYIVFMFLEILTVPVVILLFKFLEPKKIAAAIAGTLFVSLGFYIYSTSFKAKKSLTLYASFAHLFFLSMPMLIKRLVYWKSDFDEILFYGIPGPQFHKLSETFFIILFSASLIDLVRIKFESLRSGSH